VSFCVVRVRRTISRKEERKRDGSRGKWVKKRWELVRQ